MQRCGILPYEEAQELQNLLVRKRQQDEIDDRLLLLKHPPCITLGKKHSLRFLKVAPESLKERGITLHHSGRGGEITYHGQGQLIIYPILKLHGVERDLHRYLRQLEDVILKTCADLGVQAQRVPGKTGVWSGNAKLASIGVRVSKWVTSHGIALNLEQYDVENFALIHPCGLKDIRITSLENCLGYLPDRQLIEELIITNFGTVFNRLLKHSGSASVKV